tara:strand:- start:537 stop:731 length:195 start_codon:yes stop_codon:yes gene_type:complete
MKKFYKLMINYDDESDQVDSLSEVIEEIQDEAEEDIWLETEDDRILLPPEIARYLEESGILGIT